MTETDIHNADKVLHQTSLIESGSIKCEHQFEK